MPQFNATQPTNDLWGNLARQISTRRLKTTQAGTPVTPPVAQEAGAFPTSNATTTQELLQKIAGFRITLGL